MTTQPTQNMGRVQRPSDFSNKPTEVIVQKVTVQRPAASNPLQPVNRYIALPAYVYILIPLPLFFYHVNTLTQSSTKQIY